MFSLESPFAFFYTCLLVASHKDPNSWIEVSLKFFGVFLSLIGMSIHRLPCLQDYLSSDWILGVPPFSKIMPCNRFLAIWNNIRVNTQMPQPGQPDYDKLFKVREFLEDLMANFRLNYNSHREQAIVEAMIK